MFGQILMVEIDPSKTNVKCTGCGNFVEIPLSMSVIEEGVKDISRNIQDIFPTLNPGQLEMLKTGTCDDCWDKMFPEEG